MDEHDPDAPRNGTDADGIGRRGAEDADSESDRARDGGGESRGGQQFRPVRPVRPERPEDDEPLAAKRTKSSLSIILAGGALLLGIAVLAVLAAPVAGVVFGVIGLVLFLAALAAFHYVVWGWWLGSAIRAEVEAEERAEEETKRRSQGYSAGAGKPQPPQ